MHLDELVDCVEFNCTMAEDDNCTSPWGCNFTDYEYFGDLRAYFAEKFALKKAAEQNTANSTKVFIPETGKPASTKTTVAEAKAPTTPSFSDEIENLEEEEEEDEITSAAHVASCSSKVTIFLVICAVAYN